MVGKTVFKRFSLMMMMMMMMLMMMMLLKFAEHMFFHEQNSNNNLLEERLTRFAIAWPLSQRIAKKPLGIPQP